MKNELYLDSNATTELLPGALAAATQALADTFGNPSSTHSTGLRARAILNDTRDRACRLLGVGDGRLMFNSGATEGIQTAVLSALCAVRERRANGQPGGDLLLYGATEHKAVPESLAHWNRVLGLNLDIRKLPVDGDGRHDLDVLRRLAPDAALVCTMAANNEAGTISDLDGIAAALEGSPALWLVDCVQALGKLPLRLSATRIDYAPFSGHKLYAPKGIGMLYVRAGAPYTPLMIGGGQEHGLRSGTENMSGIAALGAVLGALEEGAAFRSRAELERLRQRLAASLVRSFPGVVFNTPLEVSLPTTLNITVPGLSSGQMLDVFDAAGVRVSAGSACSAAKSLPSYVLEAMGFPAWRSSNAVRISFGAATDDATIDAACRRIEECGEALRGTGWLGASSKAAVDGVIQLSSADRHTWMLLDAASGSAAVIDLQPELADRVEGLLAHHGCSVRAMLSTSGAASWPAQGDHLQVGQWRVQGIDAAPGHVCYLAGKGAEAAGFAFIGNAPASALAGILGADTVLCSGGGAGRPACTTLRARSSSASAAAADIELDAEGLLELAGRRPETIVVDVREDFEHAVSRLPGHLAAAVNIPLTRLVNALPGWLASAPQPPIVFFCRSGNRSARAASCMRALGYDGAFHLGGGLALASS